MAFLQAMARALEDVLDGHVNAAAPTPVFPTKTRVGETLGYVGAFLPVAMIVMVTELVLPIALWIYALYRSFLAALSGGTRNK